MRIYFHLTWLSKKKPNTHQQRHLWSEHGTHSTKHGSYAEQ